jgi:transposase, IS5 family
MTPQMKKELRRRSAVEPVIGHMKTDGKFGRNYLLGELGDKINALLCGAGHNIRLILKKLREKFLLLFAGLPLTLWCCSDWQKKGAGLFALAK